MMWPFNKRLAEMLGALAEADRSREHKSAATRKAFRENEDSARAVRRLSEAIDNAPAVETERKDVVMPLSRRRYGAAE